MTRFALIPLAFFANACASAEEAEEAMTDATEEVRDAFDEVEDQNARSTKTYNNRMVRAAYHMFRNELEHEGCKYVAAVAGGWTNRTFRTQLNVISTVGESVVQLKGVMQWVDNNSGEMIAKGYAPSDNQTFILEADWLNDTLDGDLLYANDAYRFFGEKRNRGVGGVMIGAIGFCKG